MYRTIAAFLDYKTGRSYDVGDIFPHSGLTETKERIRELATNANRMGFPLIQAVEGTETAYEPVSDAVKESVQPAAKAVRKATRPRKKKVAE